eukprot:COSAG01_NODE_17_length_39991_cov_30.596160_33_plen_137_part_00
MELLAASSQEGRTLLVEHGAPASYRNTGLHVEFLLYDRGETIRPCTGSAGGRGDRSAKIDPAAPARAGRRRIPRLWVCIMWVRRPGRVLGDCQVRSVPYSSCPLANRDRHGAGPRRLTHWVYGGGRQPHGPTPIRQ